MTIRLFLPESEALVSEAEKLLRDVPNLGSYGDWPLTGPWERMEGLSVYVFPEGHEVRVRTQASLASLEFGGKRYVAVVGAD